MGFVIVLTLLVGMMGAMAGSYTTDEYTPRTVTSDNGATSYRQVGYDTSSALPYDNAYCWAKGSGQVGYSRSLYANTDQGPTKTYTTACTGYSSKVEIQSVSSGIDHDEGYCYSIINGSSDELTIN